jgi:hypothetical protein
MSAELPQGHKKLSDSEIATTGFKCKNQAQFVLSIKKEGLGQNDPEMCPIAYLHH